MLLLDSASVTDAREAAALGFVRGITTNPTLMSGTGRDPAAVIGDLVDALPEGVVFHQITDVDSLAGAEAESRRFRAISPRVGIKIPCRTDLLQLTAGLVADGATCAVTAIFSPGQALLAAEAGAAYVIPYVNRSTRLLGDGVGLAADMARVCAATGRGTEVMAASLKSVDEVVATVLAGVPHLTLPLALLQDLGHHDLSEETIAAFARDAQLGD